MGLMLWVDARPDAHADDKISTINRQRFLKGLNNARSRSPYSLAIPRMLENHGKFIPAQPRGETKILGRHLKTSRETHENAIAKGMPHAVVDVFKIVDVEKKHCDLLTLSSCTQDRGIQKNKQFSTIRKAR